MPELPEVETVARQLQGWVANRLAYQRAIPRKDAAILSNCPDEDVRREWMQRIIDHDGVEPRSGRGLEMEELSEANDRQCAPAMRQQLVLLEGAQSARIDLDDLLDGGLRNSKGLSTDVGDDGVDDRERQRKRDREPRPAPRLGVHFEGTSELFDRRAHDCHANATPTDAIGLVAGREP